MAASMVGPVVGSNEVARCLYALTLMNMQHITSGDSGSMNLRVITLGHAQSAIVTMTLTYLSRTCDSHSVYVTCHLTTVLFRVNHKKRLLPLGCCLLISMFCFCYKNNYINWIGYTITIDNLLNCGEVLFSRELS